MPKQIDASIYFVNENRRNNKFESYVLMSSKELFSGLDILLNILYSAFVNTWFCSKAHLTKIAFVRVHQTGWFFISCFCSKDGNFNISLEYERLE